MIDLENIDHIYLFPGSADLRKGRQALSSLAAKIQKMMDYTNCFCFAIDQID